MSSTKNLVGYASSATLACSMASLASGSTQESATRALNVNDPLEEQVAVTFTIASGSPSTSGGTVNVYANGSNDGTLWPRIQLSSGAVYATGGGDSTAGALGSPPNLRLIGSFGIQSTTSSGERTFRTQPYSVAAAFNGVPPPAYSVFVENQTGVAFSASTTSTANLVDIQPSYTTSGN